jgi:sortase A
VARTLRAAGWTLIAAGTVVLLFLVYALFFTGYTTSTAQAEMLEGWDEQVRDPVIEHEPPEPGDDAEEDEASPPPTDGAVAVIEFVRPGSDSQPVHDGPLAVVSGVTLDDLQRGPGHYPGTALPGEGGNMGIAGHRTTYGAPFFHLDQLQEGDEVHVTDRAGETHVYRFAERAIVLPRDAWVIGPDPLETEAPMLTLTTCHPRFSARERMVVFAELVS